MGATDRIHRERLDHLQKRHEVERQGYKCACGCGLVVKGWQDSTWQRSNMPGVTGFILLNCYNSFRRYKKRNPNNPVNEASVSLWKKSQDWQLPAADKRKVLEAMDWTCQCGCDVRRESVDRNTWTHNRMPGIGGAFIASACQRNWCKKKGGREVTLENVQL